MQAAAPRAAQAVRRCAWAKVNLYLHVVGRRPDGYHDLDSLVVFAGLGDVLTVTPGVGLDLSVTGEFAAAVPSDPSNLVLRAAAGLRALAGSERGARIALEKRLPAAAGIGGGSADAAATIEGLAALWDLAPAPDRLAALAESLGADVPVCLYGRPAFVSGLGERIERAPPLPGAWLVLVNPGVPLATPQVFAAREGAFSAPMPWRDPDPDLHALVERLEHTRNDLEPPARALAPVIGDAIDALRGLSGCRLARMSGSGATCFGIFATAQTARAAAAELQASQPEWWVRAAPMLHGKIERSWWAGAAAIC